MTTNHLETFNLISFFKLIERVKDVQRTILNSSLPRRFENDAEHSFQMACFALYLLEVYAEQLGHLDKLKVISMCLLHDIVEVYTGDICAITSSEEAKKELKQREAEYIKHMREIYREFSYMHEVIEEFEKLQSEEAKFVKGIDRLVPVLIEFFGGFQTCKLKQVSFEDVMQKTKGIGDLYPFFTPIIADLEWWFRGSYDAK